MVLDPFRPRKGCLILELLTISSSLKVIAVKKQDMTKKRAPQKKRVEDTLGTHDGDERRKQESHVSYFDSRFDSKPLGVNPGEVVCSDSKDDILAVTLGSGVAMAVYDLAAGLGALSYVLIPQDVIRAFPHFRKADAGVLERACAPLHQCLAEMKKGGAGKERIRIRLFGGTTLPGDEEDAGTKNYIFVKEYLTRKGLPVMSEDLSGPYMRRLYFFPVSGRAVRCMLRRQDDYETVHKMETAFLDQ